MACRSNCQNLSPRSMRDSRGTLGTLSPQKSGPLLLNRRKVSGESEIGLHSPLVKGAKVTRVVEARKDETTLPPCQAVDGSCVLTDLPKPGEVNFHEATDESPVDHAVRYHGYRPVRVIKDDSSRSLHGPCLEGCEALSARECHRVGRFQPAPVEIWIPFTDGLVGDTLPLSKAEIREPSNGLDIKPMKARDRLCGLPSSRQRACIDRLDRFRFQGFSGETSLFDTRVVKRNICGAAKDFLPIPLGLSVPNEIDLCHR